MGARWIWLGAVLLGGSAAAWLWLSTPENPELRARQTPVTEPEVAAAAPPVAAGATESRDAAEIVAQARALAAAVPKASAERPTPTERLASENWRAPGAARSARKDPQQARREWLSEAVQPPGPQTPPNRRALWDKRVAPLLYPSGHPRAGEPLDSTTPQQLAEAKAEYVLGGLDNPAFDVPYHNVEYQLTFRDINERARSWNRTDPESNREFREWLLAQPRDPEGIAGSVRILAEPGDAGATTLREDLAAEIAAIESGG
jgi:hypothetical protein